MQVRIRRLGCGTGKLTLIRCHQSREARQATPIAAAAGRFVSSAISEGLGAALQGAATELVAVVDEARAAAARDRVSTSAGPRKRQLFAAADPQVCPPLALPLGYRSLS